MGSLAEIVADGAAFIIMCVLGIVLVVRGIAYSDSLEVIVVGSVFVEFGAVSIFIIIMTHRRFCKVVVT